jgi:hypothetical protein
VLLDIREIEMKPVVRLVGLVAFAAVAFSSAAGQAADTVSTQKEEPAAATVEERAFRPPPSLRPDGDISVYRSINFTGPYIRAQTAVPDLGIRWRIGSIRVLSGRWQFCSGVNFSGSCEIVTGDIRLVLPISPLARARSMRPIREESVGPSLRGVSAEFFARPLAAGRRIEACRLSIVSQNCTLSTALAFCRSRGYPIVGSADTETIGRQRVLADVLCKLR